eukprot:scaffold38244_cov30-Tisochrysis_lutea.AAC.3
MRSAPPRGPPPQEVPVCLTIKQGRPPGGRWPLLLRSSNLRGRSTFYPSVGATLTKKREPQVAHSHTHPFSSISMARPSWLPCPGHENVLMR